MDQTSGLQVTSCPHRRLVSSWPRDTIFHTISYTFLRNTFSFLRFFFRWNLRNTCTVMSIVNRHLSIVNLHFTEILDRTTTYESVAPTCDHCLSYGSQQVPSSFVKSLIMVSRSCSLSMSGLSSSLADAKPLAVVSRVVPAASQYQVKSSHSPTPQPSQWSVVPAASQCQS